MIVNTFMNLFMKNLVSSIPMFMERVTKRCRSYSKGLKTQNQPTATNFEQHVDYIAKDTLQKMGISWYPAICEYLSDTAIEIDTCIIQLDAKACEYTDGDFRLTSKGLKIHCGEAQTSLSGMYKTTPITGLQKKEIDGKPVYTLLSFLRWGYTDKYFADSVGILLIPHDQSMVEIRGAKSSHELRLFILNSELWILHSFSSQLAPQIQDLVQSESKSDEEILQQDQLSQNQQMDP